MERTIPIFIASSIETLQQERQELFELLRGLNRSHRQSGIIFEWNDPETMSERIVLKGSQHPLNQEILRSRFFFVIIGKKLGKYTEMEFNLALSQLENTGFPIIVPYFYMQRNAFPENKVVKFRNHLKKKLGYYPKAYSDFEAIKRKIQMELLDGGALTYNQEAFFSTQYVGESRKEV